MHYIENTKNGEFSVTLMDDSVVSPKVKYNLHDRGGRVKYTDLMNTLQKHKPKELAAFLAKNKTLKLPILYIFGRTDGTISIGGNNIYPEQVATGLHASSAARSVNNFMIERSHDAKMNVNFIVHVELRKKVKKDAKVKKSLERGILQHLLEVNLEYKEYYDNHPDNKIYLYPHVKLYAFGENKMFTSQKRRVKNKYIV